jgi:hypothetical protein
MMHEGAGIASGGKGRRSLSVKIWGRVWAWGRPGNERRGFRVYGWSPMSLSGLGWGGGVGFGKPDGDIGLHLIGLTGLEFEKQAGTVG